MRLAAVALVFAATVAAGCPSGGATKEVEEPAAAQDASKAAKAAREHIKEVYGSLRRGSTDGLLPLVDPNVVVVGPGPGDVFVDRAEAIVALAKIVEQGEEHDVESKSLFVMASPDGHAAWATDVVVIDRKTYSIGIILVEADELWAISAVHVAVPIAQKALRKRLEKGDAFPEPAKIPGATADNDAALVALFKAGAASPDVLLEQVAKSPDAIARDLDGKAREGFRAIRKQWKKDFKGMTTILKGDVHARLVPDGTLGWAIGTIDVTLDDAPPHPRRAFHVYEKTADGWAIMLAHPAFPAAR
jgi:ketosteroid isomerase-like protein